MVKTRDIASKKWTVKIVIEGIPNPPSVEYEALSAADKPKIDALIDRFAEGHPMRNEQFKAVEGSKGLVEFKQFKHRWVGFTLPGYVLVIAAYEYKKKDKLNKATLNRANDARKKMKESRRATNEQDDDRRADGGSGIPAALPAGKATP